ncbi:Na+/H+ antiporter subunit C [Thermococcus chitonophagus]|uniref:Na+/H+ antiporter subunit C n=1 Tax=Thermococcus chitonophagus TaxID=54262 RepID=A0A160VSH5_9EURY|nr:sodium:proton antiporter [Thermococcus chitonophagus]ASJ17030.1 Na+/H+ antiporter subunit C [Thermococcus chitonophagus]CUX77619.1 putative Na(+) H(+) antiporter subunit C [Thermococcus chitonophagus]
MINLWSVAIVSLVLTMVLGIYGVTARKDLVKKLISLTILGDSANAFVVALGYRINGKPPILPSGESVATFAKTAVDPLPQALVITAVVIGMAINVLLAFAIVQLRRVET